MLFGNSQQSGGGRSYEVDLVTHIGDYAFFNSKLTSLEGSASVIYIGNRAFFSRTAGAEQREPHPLAGKHVFCLNATGQRKYRVLSGVGSTHLFFSQKMQALSSLTHLFIDNNDCACVSKEKNRQDRNYISGKR